MEELTREAEFLDQTGQVQCPFQSERGPGAGERGARLTVEESLARQPFPWKRLPVGARASKRTDVALCVRFGSKVRAGRAG